MASKTSALTLMEFNDKLLTPQSMGFALAGKLSLKFRQVSPFQVKDKIVIAMMFLRRNEFF